MTARALIVVADTGPLIALAKLEMLDLLAALPWHFYAPAAVISEATADACKPGARAISNALGSDFLAVQQVSQTPTLNALKQLLDEGEAEAIALAFELSAALLIDERRGRKVAKQRKIRVIGTGGILLYAKQQGVIDRIGPLLSELQTMGYRLSDALIKELKRMARE